MAKGKSDGIGEARRMHREKSAGNSREKGKSSKEIKAEGKKELKELQQVHLL